ncbi:MAG: hypothetical protein QY306_14525 [Anaerolineales bacterium]|nr:MAG: hypothetical protein QY306_14525 [Anaerolineales bacterium]
MNKSETRREFWFTAALVAFVAFVTYGVLIPQLGFYRDDWYMLQMGQWRGAAGLIEIFQTDRPFIGYLFAIYFRLFGTAPLGWHLAALAIKIIGAVSFLWLMRLLFPGRRDFTTWTTLLYIVYPGFLQQPVAATYIHLLLAVTASILSLALTSQAIQQIEFKWKFVLTVAASALTLLYLLIFETMIGLEVARFFIVVYLIMQTQQADWRSAIRKSILWMIPYAITSGGFLAWRLFFFNATRHSTDLDALLAGYSVSPLRSIVTILVELGKDFIELVFLSWAAPLYQFTANGDIFDLASSLVVAALALGGILVYSRVYKSGDDPVPTQSKASLWLGALIAVFALMPINLAGRNILFSAQWDRYTLHAAFGGVLLLGNLIYISFREQARRVLLFALVATGVVVQYQSAAEYRNFWELQREVWWQMTWRAPDLQENTLIYVRLPPGYAFFEDYEIYGPANLVYAPDASIRIAADLITPRTVPLLIQQEVKGNRNRGVYVHRNYKNALMFTFPTPDSCLHAIDGRLVELPDYSQNDLLLISTYSKIERIDIFASGVEPPAKLFGSAPETGWCYYYQKISLERQQEDWEGAAQLAEEANRFGYQPRDPSEWFPVFEAYANTGRFELATEIGREMLQHHDMILLYCSQLEQRTDLPVSYNRDFSVSTLCSNTAP